MINRLHGRFFLIVLFVMASVSSQAQFNLVQRSLLTFPGERVAGVWHYVDSLNREYALVGTEHGISIVDVTDPVNPDFILQVPGISNLWHEVKVWGKYAYATTEGTAVGGINDGLQIIDLRYLPDSAPYRFWHGDGAIAGLLHRAHSVTVDNGYVYVNGNHITALHSGVLIADLVDPWNPHYVGADTGNYCHDSFVRGDTLWASELGGGFSVYDISDRSAPVLLANHSTPANFNHNTWLSDNSQVLFTTDERNHAPLGAYDVSDLSNIDDPLDKYKVVNIINPNISDEVHNVRVLNDFLINACYGSQVTIVDAARPANLIETGNFPIITPLVWDVDPYLPSGNILATGETTGLHILAPTYIRACYLEGNVTDAVTGLPLNNALVNIQATYVLDSTNLDGDYKTGYPTAGTYTVQFSCPGYITQIISNVLLSNGTLIILNVQLVPVTSGINESNFPLSVFVSPNPFHESAEMIIDQKLISQHGSLTVLLKDVTGRAVRRITGISSSTVKITRDKLGSGVYFYEVIEGKNFLAEGKLIID